MQFDHEKLDVYRVSIEFIGLADVAIGNFPVGRGYLADQLQRAATSIAANIAEGAGEFSRNEKARFYRMALRSGTECAALLDVAMVLKIVDAALFEAARRLLLRIVGMLTRMVRSLAEAGS